MTDIKRYEMEKEYSLDINVIPVEEHDGSFVRYDDHAAIVAELQEKVRVLAAEADSLKKFCKNAAFYADYESELGMERGGFTDGLNDIKTSATDDAIREIRAQAVEEFAKHLRGHMQDGSPLGLLAMGADEFADRIRSGEQP